MQEKTGSPITDINNKLNEAKATLEKQQALERRNLWPSSLLKISQYVIGGILTASFFQDFLSAQVTGLLGLLVLLSTFMHQRYHPDVKFINARTRILKLKRLIRTVEDSVSALEVGDKEAADEISIVKDISDSLDEVERSQHLDYALMRRKFLDRFAKPVSDVGVV